MSEFKELLYLDWRFRQFKASTFVNGLFYFLGRIPLVGKYVPTTMLYREYGLKKGVAGIKLALSFLISFAIQSIPFALSFVIAKGVNTVSDEKISVFFVWFVLFNLGWTCIAKIFPSLNKQEIQFITNFRVSKEQYIKRTTILSTLKDMVFMLPGMIVLGVTGDNVILYLLIGLFSFLSMSLIWSVIELHMTLMKNRLALKLTLISAWTLVIVGGAFWLLINQELAVMEQVSLNWMTAFIWLVVWFPFLYLYVHFKHYDQYAQQMFKSSEVMINYSSTENKEKQQYLGEGQKMKLEKTANDKRLDHLTGSNYLNTLLFSRFNTALRKQLLYRVGGISIVMLGIVIASILFPIGISGEKMETIFYNFIPAMFFILYLLSFGKKVVQTIFVNCDSSMLAYPFYRESGAIVRGFFYRFFKTFYYNGIISATIYVWVFIFNIVNHQPLGIDFLLILAFVMISLSILFSFHELFVYYILQPFTSDFQVKNPVYKVVDGLFYFLAYFSLQIKTAGFIYALLVSGFSLVYFVIGIIVITKVAPKTFKLKN